MKVGDLVRPIQLSSHHSSSAPIVEQDWFGIIIDFTGDYFGPDNQFIEKGNNPVVYWNPQFHSEIEYPEQIEVI